MGPEVELPYQAQCPESNGQGPDSLLRNLRLRDGQRSGERGGMRKTQESRPMGNGVPSGDGGIVYRHPTGRS